MKVCVSVIVTYMYICIITVIIVIHVCQYMQGTVNDIENFVQWSRVKMDGNVAMRIGSQKQVSE